MDDIKHRTHRFLADLYISSISGMQDHPNVMIAVMTDVLSNIYRVCDEQKVIFQAEVSRAKKMSGAEMIERYAPLEAHSIKILADKELSTEFMEHFRTLM